MHLVLFTQHIYTQAKEHCNGLELDGRRIRVDYSITKRPHTPTPGVYMGKPTHPSPQDRYHDDDYYDKGGGYDKGSYDKGSYDKGSYDKGSYDKRSYSKGGYGACKVNTSNDGRDYWN